MAETHSITCGHCGKGVAADIVAQQQPFVRGMQRVVLWLKCPSCNDASVMTSSHAVYPAAPAGRSIQHLPEDIERAWQEARTAHAVAAYTASEMMLRKILMHVAVDKAKSKAGQTFASYVQDLENNGYLTAAHPIIESLKVSSLVTRQVGAEVVN